MKLPKKAWLALPGFGDKRAAHETCAHENVKPCLTSVGGMPSVIEVPGWRCLACDADFTTDVTVNRAILRRAKP